MKHVARFVMDLIAGLFFMFGALSVGASIGQALIALLVVNIYGIWCFTDGTGLLWRK